MSNSLQGLRILNTRPKDQAQILTAEITKAGGIVIACPTLEIQATSPEWVINLPDLNTIDQAIFVSSNAVRCCFNQLQAQALHWPKTIKVIAIGLSTAKALKAYGVDLCEIPPMPDSESLLALNSLQRVKNQRLLLVRGKGGRPLIETQLLQRGAKVFNLVVYERTLPNIEPSWIDSIWRRDLVDVILITSEDSLANLLQLFGDEARPWLESKTYCIISERLAKAASALGLKKLIVSHPNQVMDALFKYYKGLTHGQTQ